MKKILYAILALVALLSACVAAPAYDTQIEAVEMTKVEIIHDTPQVFESNMQDDFLLLDVRTPEEYAEGHIDGSLLIPVTELESRLDEIAQYTDKSVLVYCRSGNRSVTASNILIENGFSEVHNLLTGFNGWVNYKNN